MQANQDPSFGGSTPNSIGAGPYGNGTGSTVPFNDGNWHHLLVTGVSSLWTVYVDGTQVAQKSMTTAIILGGTLQIGKGGIFAGHLDWTGKIDDVAIFASDVSGSLAYLAAGLIDPLSLSPVGYWRMEEGTGTTTADASGNGNTGTLNGGVTWSNDTPAYLQDYADSGYQTSNSYSFYYRSSGSLRYMVIGISAYANVSFGAPSVTVNGTSASLLGFQSGPPAGQGVLLYGLVAPDAPYGSALQVTVTYASGVNNSLAAAISLTGVDQSSSTEAVTTANATNVGSSDATVTTTTSTSGDFLVAVVNTSDTSITVGTGQTETVNNSQTLGTGAMSYKGPISPAGSATMYWTGVGALQTWAIAVVGIKADGATPPVTEQMPWFVTRTIFEEVYEEILNH